MQKQANVAWISLLWNFATIDHSYEIENIAVAVADDIMLQWRRLMLGNMGDVGRKGRCWQKGVMLGRGGLMLAGEIDSGEIIDNAGGNTDEQCDDVYVKWYLDS